MSTLYSSDKTNPTHSEQAIPLMPTTYHAYSGLDYLRTINSFYVKQQPSITEALFGIASESKFDIFDDKHVRIFQALETSSFCQRFCCATRRSFSLSILDNANQEVMVIKRRFKCCSGCCWCANCQCCSQEVTVESPPGTLIGTVSQTGSCCRTMFSLKDSNDNHVFTARGPLCNCDGPLSCRCENKFSLIGTDGITEVGAIYKKYRGFAHEMMTSADAYLLQVPMDLDIKMKAVSLATLFLIEYMIYAAVPDRN